MLLRLSNIKLFNNTILDLYYQLVMVIEFTFPGILLNIEESVLECLQFYIIFELFLVQLKKVN